MKVGDTVKLFTARMFGVVVTGRVLWVARGGKWARVRCYGSGVFWVEKVRPRQIVPE